MTLRNRLVDFVKPMCFCPCCEREKKCLKDCTFAVDYPRGYEALLRAREAFYGPPKLKRLEISSSIVDDAGAQAKQAEEG